MQLRPRIAQSAVLAYRGDGKGLRVLLITSRGTRRWVVPKGGLLAGMTPGESAAEEAFEEAGVRGRVDRRCLGFYTYGKLQGGGRVFCRVRVYAMRVSAEFPDWPERRQRRRAWMTVESAIARVREPGLRKILAVFAAASEAGNLPVRRPARPWYDPRAGRNRDTRNR